MLRTLSRRAATATLSIVLIVSAVLAGVAPAAAVTGINVSLPPVPTRHAIIGEVRREANSTPVPGVQVRALDAGSGNTRAIALTDSHGDYELAGLPAGNYQVRFETELNLQDGFLGANGPAFFAPTRSGAATIVVSTGDETVHTVRLPTGLRISGTVTGATGGSPVAHETVIARINGNTIGQAVTAADGTYQIVGLRPGSYKLVFLAISTVNVQDGCLRGPAPGHFTSACASGTFVQLTNADVTGRNVALPTGFAITGAVADRITGDPLCARISIGEAQPDPSTSTDSASGVACGAFGIAGLSPGDYIVRITPGSGLPNFVPGYFSASVGNHWVRDRANATILTVGPNGSTGTMKPPVGALLTGSVHSPTDQAIAGATVYAVDGDGHIADKTTTNGTGSFTVKFLGAGGYRLVFKPPMDRPTLEPGWYDAAEVDAITSHHADATTLHIGWGATVNGIDVNLRQGSTITGHIESTGHQPLPHVSVSAVDDPDLDALQKVVGTQVSRTDVNGAYGLGGLPPGSPKVRISEPTGDFLDGWYKNGAPGDFTTDESQATPVAVP
jgi:hypothetical protein